MSERVLVEVKCPQFDCETKTVVPAEIRGHVESGGRVEIEYDYSCPEGWGRLSRWDPRLFCPKHKEIP